MDEIKVKYGLLKKITDALEKIGFSEDDEVTFEYVVGSCFPDIYENVKEVMRQQYTMGYIAGLNDGKN